MIKDAIKRRPWILIVIMMGVLMLLNVIFVVIAISNPPILVG
jgi:hypothetical protein